MDGRGARTSERLRVLYRDVDDRMDAIGSGVALSCRRGCAHCCQMPVMASIPEALVLVEHLLARPGGEAGLRARLPEMRRQTELLYDRSTTHAGYFARQIPCVFLDPDGACGVYPARPTACRLHAVTSPADHCAASSDLPVAKLDLADLHDGVWAEAMIAARAEGIPFGYGPLPLAVTLALALATGGREALLALLDGTPFGRGVPSDQAEWAHLTVPSPAARPPPDGG